MVLITAGRGEDANVWPIDWHMPASLEPQRYVAALMQGAFGTGVVVRRRAFVVNTVPASWEGTILRAGALSGATTDKFHALGLRTRDAATVDAIRLVDAAAVLECEVELLHDIGSHVLAVARVRHAEGTPVVELTHRTRP